MKLPAELRELIFHFLLVHGRTSPAICILASHLPPTFTSNILSYIEDDSQYLQSGDRIDTAILRVNKQLRSEAGYYFYAKLRFRVNSAQLPRLMMSSDILGWLRHIEIEDVRTGMRDWGLIKVMDTLAASPNIKGISFGTNVFDRREYSLKLQIELRSYRRWEQQEVKLNKEYRRLLQEMSKDELMSSRYNQLQAEARDCWAKLESLRAARPEDRILPYHKWKDLFEGAISTEWEQPFHWMYQFGDWGTVSIVNFHNKLSYEKLMALMDEISQNLPAVEEAGGDGGEQIFSSGSALPTNISPATANDLPTIAAVPVSNIPTPAPAVNGNPLLNTMSLTVGTVSTSNTSLVNGSSLAPAAASPLAVVTIPASVHETSSTNTAIGSNSTTVAHIIHTDSPPTTVSNLATTNHSSSGEASHQASHREEEEASDNISLSSTDESASDDAALNNDTSQAGNISGQLQATNEEDSHLNALNNLYVNGDSSNLDTTASSNNFPASSTSIQAAQYFYESYLNGDNASFQATMRSSTPSQDSESPEEDADREQSLDPVDESISNKSSEDDNVAKEDRECDTDTLEDETRFPHMNDGTLVSGENSELVFDNTRVSNHPIAIDDNYQSAIALTEYALDIHNGVANAATPVSMKILSTSDASLMDDDDSSDVVSESVSLLYDDGAFEAENYSVEAEPPEVDRIVDDNALVEDLNSPNLWSSCVSM